MIEEISNERIRSGYLTSLAEISDQELLTRIIDETEKFHFEDSKNEVKVCIAVNYAKAADWAKAVSVMGSMDRELVYYDFLKFSMAMQYATTGLDTLAINSIREIRDAEVKANAIENMSIIHMSRGPKEFVSNFPDSVSLFAPFIIKLKLSALKNLHGGYAGVQETRFSRQSFYINLLQYLIYNNHLVEAEALLTKVKNKISPDNNTKIKIEAVRKSMESNLKFKD